MKTVTLFGAGKIGIAITALLTSSGRYSVRVCDHHDASAKKITDVWPNSTHHALKLEDEKATMKLLEGADAVISALPFFCNVKVAELAAKAGVHYFDLTEDVKTTKRVMELAENASSYLVPQCGLAPGFISIAASHLINSFDSVDTVKMRVGALPIYPSNALKYNLTWSTDGLLNEYANLCELIEDGEKRLAFPLEGYERFSLDGVEYEAFNTSGGLGTLCDSYEGKLRSLNYKTVRYPGHRDLISFLMNELRFREDQPTLKHVLERSIPATAQDKCIIFVEVRGNAGGRFVQRTYASTVYNTYVKEQHFGAIQVTTASGVCAPLDLILSGKVTSRKGGLVRLEEISLPSFLSNEFGKYYHDDRALSGIR